MADFLWDSNDELPLPVLSQPFPSAIQEPQPLPVLTPFGQPQSQQRTSQKKSAPTSSNIIKRHRGGPTTDARSACWTSPLCPNNGKEGTPPSPSTCGAKCAPFLFADVLKLSETPENVKFEDAIESTESIEPPEPPRSETKRKHSNRNQPLENPQSASAKDSPSPDTSPSESTEATAGRSARQPHNQVERKYRENINARLENLRRVVPSLQQSPNGNGPDIEDLPAPAKPSKAVILASATAYIKQAEKEKKQLANENELLKAKVKELQALIKCDDCSLVQYVMDMKIRVPTT
ncbi:hypothetical protein K402DRAFT_328495 [Aulographum hederae CBS 113979]|uniref:BHLH domain-containing protein n=1 Tax=Aulographum hederae CBS 113979 TaxID=1176131 RepID=A0A6G1H615_9PEZI|nr:hypothetical protein K402DRAFT_328495 [Aulographum hederae CBS 113979]